MLLAPADARVFHAPAAARSAGDDFVECARLAGLVLDGWQEAVLRAGLGERPDGSWCAREVGVCVPRQNGKGAIIEALELGWLFVTEEPLVIHSAHLFDTSKEAMRRLLVLIESVPEFDRRVLKKINSHGEEGVLLRGGQRIRFKTRTKGGGRGLTGDKIVLDEAMILPQEVMGALLPTMSARPDGQAWYFGSAVDQLVHLDGVQFARVRERGLAGDDRLAWFEWSVEAPGPSSVDPEVLADPVVWRSANPADRVTEEAIRTELLTLPARTFAVERLGIGDWPDTHAGGEFVLDVEAWDGMVDAGSSIRSGLVLAFDVPPDRSSAAVAAAGLRGDGVPHVEIVEHRRSTGWLVPRLRELREKHRPVAVVCDALGPAGAVVAELERAGVQVLTVSTREYADACGMLFDLTEQRGLRHLGSGELRDAIRGAKRRPLGDRFAWARRSEVDIAPLVAATLAVYGTLTSKPVPRSVYEDRGLLRFDDD